MILKTINNDDDNLLIIDIIKTIPCAEKKACLLKRENFDAAEKFRLSMTDKYKVKVELVGGSALESKTVEKYFQVQKI